MELLKRKTAVVYGGSGRLGEVIVRSLHAEGANVVIHYYSNREKAEKTAFSLDPSGNTVFALQADSTDAASMEAAVKRITDRFGFLDIVVNAVHGPFKPVSVFDSEPEDWEVHSRGLISHYLAAKTALPVMRTQGGGRIIYISAAMAVRYGEGCSMYTTVKSGLNSFCRTLAMEEGRNNILVNIVCPGGVADAETQSGDVWDEMTEKLRSRCALGRFATAKEVANTVVYFSSPLSDGITGQTIYVSGGEIML